MYLFSKLIRFVTLGLAVMLVRFESLDSNVPFKAMDGLSSLGFKLLKVGYGMLLRSIFDF